VGSRGKARLVKELKDPLAPGLVAVRELLGPGKVRLEIGEGHMVLVSGPGLLKVLGPGWHELSLAQGPTVLCWLTKGPLTEEGGRPFSCVLPITEGRLSDGYFMGVICRFKLMIWAPWTFLKSMGPGGRELGLSELWGKVKGIIRSSLANSLAYCGHGDVEDPCFPDYLAHSINLALAGLGLRTCCFKVVEKALRGPFRSPEELLDHLRKSLPSMAMGDSSARLSERLELVRNKPWLLVKPERGPEEWKENWLSFWTGLLEDWMKVNRRFYLDLEELSSLEPFSRMRPEHLAEVVKALGGNGHVVSRSVLEGLCSLLPDWARENGLYVLDMELLMDLGFSEHEAGRLLRELVSRGFFKWTKPGREAVIRV